MIKNFLKLFLVLALITPVNAKRVAINKGYVGAPYTYNITASNTSAFRTVANAHSRNAIVAFMGDSTMRGVDETAFPYNSQYPNSMPMQLAALFNAANINSGANNWFGISGTTFNDYMIRDSRVASSGATTAFGTAVPIQGGAEVEFPTATGTFSFTSQASVNKCDFYYQDSTAGRSFNYNFDGNANTLITTAGTNTILKVTVDTGSLGNHTINFSWVAAFVRIYGVNCYNDLASRTEISMFQWGISGGTSSDMILDTGTPSSGRIRQLTLFPPDLVICECGVINSWRNSRSIANVKADLTTLVQSVKATGANFIFLTPPYDNGSTGATSSQDAYVNTMYQVAFEQGVGLIDIRKKWISYANSVNKGYQVSNDAVHPTLVGYKDEAGVLFTTINAILNNSF
jgi:hypothetical protein